MEMKLRKPPFTFFGLIVLPESGEIEKMGVKKVYRFSGMDYVDKKIEESRHNETLAYLMFMTGAIFFVGGLLETLVMTENPNWFLFFPYRITPHAYSLLGLFMVLYGFMLVVSGIVFCFHYASGRAFYLNQLKEVSLNKNNRKSKTRAPDRGTKLFAKQLSQEHKELGECKRHLMNHMGLNEDDSMYYCKLLDNRWRELLEEENIQAHKQRRI